LNSGYLGNAQLFGYNAAFHISCFGVTASGGTSLTVTQQQIINQSEVNIIILGGDAGTTTPILSNPTKLDAYLTSEENSSANTPVVPLSYQVNYLSDNTPMLLMIGAKGEYRNCNSPTPGPTDEPTVEPTPGTTSKTITYNTTVSSFNWVLPDDAASTSITVELIGGGQGGSSGSFNNSGQLWAAEVGQMAYSFFEPLPNDIIDSFNGEK